MSNCVSKSGQVGVKTTAFNQTCDRLREYLKEKRALDNNTITLTPPSTRTMNLFPLKNRNDAVLPSAEKDDCDQHVLSDMTIFYNGRVIVIENVPLPKAEQIFRVVTDLSSGVTAPPVSSRPAAISNNSVACDLSYLTHPIARDLAQTRSRSLTRFLEKRKERINAAGAPYTLKDKSWLGLSTASGN